MIDHAREKVGGHGAMHQRCIERIAHCGALHLRVENDLQRRIQIGGVVHEQVANADAARDDGNAAVFAAELVQTRAAARDDHIHVFVQLQQFGHARPIGVVDELHGFSRQAGFLQRLLNDGHQRAIGVQRLAAAAQDDGIACFQRQPGHVHRDVGARFVDHAQHAQRHALLVDLQTVGQGGRLEDLAHRIGQRGDIALIGGDALQPRFVQQQPIDQRG